MTAQTVKKHGGNKSIYKGISLGREERAELAKKIKLFFIATKMKKAGLPDLFVVSAVNAALEFDGVADLMSIWQEEDDKKEKEEIVADIQDMIEACEQKEKIEEMYIRFNDLDAIAENIRAFKDSLYELVMTRGGITKLSEVTGIPQPSLSRFFNSNSMPRRATVLAIAKALDLDGLPIDLKWTK